MKVFHNHDRHPAQAFRDAASGRVRIDPSRGGRNARVSSEWFSCPDDERHLSLSVPHAANLARVDEAMVPVGVLLQTLKPNGKNVSGYKKVVLEERLFFRVERGSDMDRGGWLMALPDRGKAGTGR